MSSHGIVTPRSRSAPVMPLSSHSRISQRSNVALARVALESSQYERRRYLAHHVASEIRSALTQGTLAKIDPRH
jgi:hypothetical protein